VILALNYPKQYIECVAFFHSSAIAIGSSSLLRLLLRLTNGLLSNELSRLALNEEVPRRGFFVACPLFIFVFSNGLLLNQEIGLKNGSVMLSSDGSALPSALLSSHICSFQSTHSQFGSV
jgi:hypothetical protein